MGSVTLAADYTVGISVDGVRLSSHGRQRMNEMGLDDEEVLAALRHPELTYPGSRNHMSGRTCYVRGRIMVVCVENRVISVLWHREESR